MIYWHRRFILAYENMLRSLEPRFACITIPYWDYFADFARRLAGQCTTFEGCSTFLTEFGGSVGPSATVSINGISTTGNCVSAGPLSNFCQSSTLTGTSSCSQCLPRGNWLSTAFPSGFGYASLARVLSGSYGYAWFSQNIHYGIHNSIHNAAGSTMATLATSADPIFYNHHSTIDLVHQIFYDCQVGRPMTEAEKKSSPYAFQQCSLSSADVCPTVLSNMTQDWQAGSSLKMKAENHPLLAPFFSPLPSQYWFWVSNTDLGSHSYTYESDTLMTVLQASGLSCPKNRIRRSLQSFFTVSRSTDLRTQAVIRTFNLFQDLFNDALSAVRSKDPALEQVELAECSYYLNQFGSVDDYSDAFRRNFGLPANAHTNCYQRIIELRSGAKRILISNWMDKFRSYLQGV
ncbi:hypothetical protein ATCC90586_006155 [Pythium insidiosum]|nr:hypothetical protein ATCC90586_006155 [Pythium insidiosum]